MPEWLVGHWEPFQCIGSVVILFAIGFVVVWDHKTTKRAERARAQQENERHG